MPPRDSTQARDSLSSLQEDVVRTRSKTEYIFDFSQLKAVSNSLDFDSATRMSRDGSKEIEIHNRSFPDENLKYQIFDFANPVCRYSRLSDGLRNEVVKHCATVLFYDSGYKSVSGMSRLDKT